MTARGLIATSGVSTRTFYVHFSNVDDCFSSTYEAILRNTLNRLSTRKEEHGEQLFRTQLQFLMQDVAHNPATARLALVESYDAGPAMRKVMASTLRAFERLLCRAFALALHPVRISPLLAGGFAAGVQRVMRSKVLEGRHADLPQLTDALCKLFRAVCHSYLSPSLVSGWGLPATEAPDAPARHSELELPMFQQIGSDRDRLLSATIKLAAREGYWNLTIPSIRAAAGVSRRDFDAHFRGVAECYLAAIEGLTAGSMADARARADGENSIVRSLRAASAFCVEAAQKPRLARLGFVDVLAPGLAGLECRERMIAIAAKQLQPKPPSGFRGIASETMAAAGWRIVEAQIETGQARRLPEVAPLVAAVILAPHRGTHVAGDPR